MYVRYDPGTGHCGRSYATGRGTPITLSTLVRQYDCGYSSVGSRLPITIARPGVVRFCVWQAGSAADPVQARAQDVVFSDWLFGASLTAGGTYSNEMPRAAGWSAASTVPFEQTSVSCVSPTPTTATIDRVRREP